MEKLLLSSTRPAKPLPLREQGSDLSLASNQQEFTQRSRSVSLKPPPAIARVCHCATSGHSRLLLGWLRSAGGGQDALPLMVSAWVGLSVEDPAGTPPLPCCSGGAEAQRTAPAVENVGGVLTPATAFPGTALRVSRGDVLTLPDWGGCAEAAGC